MCGCDLECLLVGMMRFWRSVPLTYRGGSTVRIGLVFGWMSVLVSTVCIDLPVVVRCDEVGKDCMYVNSCCSVLLYMVCVSR